ncbi:MerR family transcriptional regulator [Bhargavaea cecembensis]|uniref:MerR family transcriptional regulator n=1 Tax=Bhargavaea cecembensis TaxID=394098 RepID=A0A161RIB5_9BACL|nr:MerR family transcriptional regulator [Bhargavaea cecembensis]KZE39862.1 MerR family transcriptional regulator [Bhargavaea cecembensis]
MLRKVKEVAELTGISIRTLHHYDRIGLLSPEQVTEAGYRQYSDRDLETLQQILFFRELGFQLKRIGEILKSPEFDREEALLLQREALLEKRARLDRMIGTLEKTIQDAKGEIEMTDKEKFEGFDFTNNPYEDEARRRWGDEAVDRSNQALANMGPEGQKQTGEQMEALFRKLAAMRNQDPDSEEVQQAIGEWHAFLNSMGHTYSPEAFKGLGQLYIQDERFTRNMDKFGDGFARFMAEAMGIRSDRLQG